MTKTQIAFWGAVIILFACVAHVAMMKDQASLCDRGAMEGKECQD